MIANHALLLSDLASRSRVLPDYDILVVDEAHHLEDEATQQLGWRLGSGSCSPGSSGLEPGPAARRRGSRGAGLAQRGERPALAARAAADPRRRRAERSAARPRRCDASSRPSRACWKTPTLAATARRRRSNPCGSPRPSGPARPGRSSSICGPQPRASYRARRAGDRRGHRGAGGRCPARPTPRATWRPSWAATSTYWRDVRRRLTSVLHQRRCQYASTGSRGGGALPDGLAQRRAARGREPAARAAVRARPERRILVSATLAIGGSFDYVKRRLGLDDARAVALGSPFDYQQAALSVRAERSPDPTQSGYQSRRRTGHHGRRHPVGGRTLVLFTSRAHLRATYQALREPLAAERITLLAQGIDEGSAHAPARRLPTRARVVLFGTNAFWEGIDVVGDALSCVMVTRLPFAVPSDPIYAARAEQFDDPFTSIRRPASRAASQTGLRAVDSLTRGPRRCRRPRSAAGDALLRPGLRPVAPALHGAPGAADQDWRRGGRLARPRGAGPDADAASAQRRRVIERR